jgi:AraC-like DNA-binding protein
MGTDQVSGGAVSSYFTVDTLPMHERYGVWKESIDVLFGVDADKSIRDNNFTASIESHLLGSMMIMEVTSREQNWGRDNLQIARNGMDHYGIGIFKEGDLFCDTAKGPTKLPKGGLVVFDLTQEFIAHTSDLRVMTFVVPRPLIEDMVNLPDDHSMRFLDPKNPMTRIVYDQMMSIHRNIARIGQQQAQVIEKSFSMMVATCLNDAVGGDRETVQHRQKLLNLVKVRRYIRDQLASPDLTPRKVARDLGVSRSKLYDSFSAYGGVYQYIREMRLRRAMSLLNDPMRHHSSIYDIALECGFASDASFIRAFREQYELTPGDVKNGVAAIGQNPSASSEKIDNRYENWLHELAV